MRSIRSFTGNLRRLFSREIFGRKSVYRIEKLKNSIKKGENSDVSNIEKNERSSSLSKGVRQYEKRHINRRGERVEKFFSLKNLVIIGILFLTFVYIHFSGYSTKSLYVSIFIFIGVTLYMIIVERFRERIHIEGEIQEIKKEREREHDVFLEKVKDIEELEKNRLTSIILKNSEDYDVKIWKIGRASSLLLGKGTPRNRVDVDLGEAVYGNLVSRAHGILNRVNGVWYYEDLGSQNGSGIEKRKDGRKIKIKKNTPVKVESGDIIYLATTKLLIQ